MSKINAIRIINLNYNHDQRHISDMALNVNQMTTLFTLSNGGGKTVILQNLIAPFVHRNRWSTTGYQYQDYFTTTKPTFVLVEMALDQNAGYLLVGMMVRKNQAAELIDSNNPALLVEATNFICEYKHPCKLDIRHLPVIDTTADGKIVLKGYNKCRDLFKSFEKDPSAIFFSYDMSSNDRSTAYYKKLREYGIMPEEWESIIQPINLKEGGLADLFKDSKDEASLLRNNLLPTVEKKLNRDSDRIASFRQILEQYINKCSSNEENLQRREAIQQFQSEMQAIQEQAGIYLAASNEELSQLDRVIAFMKDLEALEELTKDEINSLQEQIYELRAEIKNTYHQKYSSQYHSTQEKIRDLEAQQQHLDDVLTQTRELLAHWDRQAKIQAMAEQQERVNNAEADFQRTEQELDICRSKDKDLQPERDYIGYLLRSMFQERIDQASGELDEVSDSIRAKSNQMNHAKEAARRIAKEIAKCSEQSGRLNALVENYNTVEANYARQWDTDLNRNLMGEYDDSVFQSIESSIQTRTDDLRQKESDADQSVSTAKEAEKQQNDELQNIEVSYQLATRDLSSAQEKLARYEDELSERKAAMQYFGLDVEQVFNKQEILESAEKKIQTHEADCEILNVAIKEAKQRLEMLSTGQAVKIPDRLQALLNNLGIHTVYGMEWLKRNENTEEENLKLVEANEFLPYALIMSESDLQRLQNAEEKVYTEFPVPIVTRESLKSQKKVNTGDSLPLSVNFYVVFNRNLLNEAKLAEMEQTVRDEIEKKEQIYSLKKDELKEYNRLRGRIDNQEVTAELYDGVKSQIERLTSDINSFSDKKQQAEDRLAEIQAELRKAEEELHFVKSALEKIGQERLAFQTLKEEYASYLEHRGKLSNCIDTKKRLEDEQQKTEAEITDLESNITELKSSQATLRSLLSDLTREAVPYQTYQEASCPAGFNLSIESDQMALTSRYEAITSEVSRNVKELETELERKTLALQREQTALQQKAKQRSLNPEDWAGVNYSYQAEEHANEQIKTFSQKSDALTKDIHKTEVNLNVTLEQAEQILRKMNETCDTREPLTVEEITVIDYDQAIKNLESDIYDANQEIDSLSDRIDSLERALHTARISLAQYGAPEQTHNPVSFTEDFSQFNSRQLATFASSLSTALTTAQKETQSCKGQLYQMLNKLLTNDSFDNRIFRKPIDRMIGCIESAERVSDEISQILTVYERKLELLEVDLKIIDEDRKRHIDDLTDYVHELHTQLGKIDKNALAEVRGKQTRMLYITLADWDKDEAIYRRRVEDYLDYLTKEGLRIIKLNIENNGLSKFIGTMFTLANLYDKVVGISNASIKLYKVEENGGKIQPWRDAASKNSGAESFLNAGIILFALMNYLHHDEADVFADKNSGKVLLMDNPFANTTAPHIVNPFFSMAARNNIQIFSVTGVREPHIQELFDNIYEAKIIKANKGKLELLEATHVVGDDFETIDPLKFDIVNEGEQMSMLF